MQESKIGIIDFTMDKLEEAAKGFRIYTDRMCQIGGLDEPEQKVYEETMLPVIHGVFDDFYMGNNDREKATDAVTDILNAIITKGRINKASVAVPKAELKSEGAAAECFAETFEDNFKSDKVRNETVNIEVTADISKLQEGLAEVKEGFAELEALPISERKPQMPEEKKELVSLLMGFVRTTVNPDMSAPDEYIEIFPSVVAVLADLVN